MNYLFDDYEKSYKISSETFGANIHDLLRENFFMHSTIGSYALKNINKAINLLNQELVEITEDDRVFIKQIIDIIGEPLIKNKLDDMYKKKF